MHPSLAKLIAAVSAQAFAVPGAAGGGEDTNVSVGPADGACEGAGELVVMS